MNRKIWRGLSAALFFVFLGVNSVYGCTSFFLKTTDGSIISARTDEFYSETGAQLDVVPQGTEFTTTAPKGGKAMAPWKNRYGFVGISFFEQHYIGDGMNEVGLATGGLYFDDAKYPALKASDSVINLMDLPAWILGNFKTVTEVKAALGKIKVWAPVNPMLKEQIPMHLYVTDANGGSIVVEWIKEKLVIWDNRKNGVMANEPSLDWHLNNLRYFSNLNPNSHPLPGLDNPKWAQGSGLLGLPGDYSCASRFVRISMLKYFSQLAKDAQAGVNLARHLMNNIDIPYGPQIWVQNGADNIQWTIWTVIYDLTHKQFYYYTYQNQNLRRIDLTKLPLGQGNQRTQCALFGGDSYIDDTARLMAK